MKNISKNRETAHNSQNNYYTFQSMMTCNHSSNQLKSVISPQSSTDLSTTMQILLIPVIGASTSIIVFSCLSMAAPSLIIFKATSSSSRPSFTKWFFKTSILGFPFSNTSFKLSRWVGGKGTARKKRKKKNFKQLKLQKTTIKTSLLHNKLSLKHHHDLTSTVPELHGEKKLKILCIIDDRF